MFHKKGIWPIILLITCFIWGTQHPALKILSRDFSPTMLNFIRFAITSVVLLPFILLHKFHIKPKDIIGISILSLIGNALFGVLNITGLRISTSSNNSILTNTWPLMLVALSPFLIKEKVSRKSLIGMLIGFIGVIFVLTQKTGITELVNSQYFVGNIFILISALCIAIQTMFNKRYIQRYGSLEVAFCGVTAAAIILMIISVLTGDITSIAHINLDSFLLFLWVAIITTAITWVIWYEGIRRIGLVNSSAFILLIPLSGVISSSIILHDFISPIFILGAILILSGVYTVQIKRIKG